MDTPHVVQSRRKSAQPQFRPPKQALISLDDLRFVNEFEARSFQSPGQIDAYQAVHPGCKRASAKVSAARLLMKATVQEEIRLRIERTKAVTLDTLSACLHKYRGWAEAEQDYQAAADITMNQAKLAGLLVEKREVKDVSSDAATPIRALVDAAMQTSQPLPPPSGGN